MDFSDIYTHINIYDFKIYPITQQKRHVFKYWKDNNKTKQIVE